MKQSVFDIAGFDLHVRWSASTIQYLCILKQTCHIVILVLKCVSSVMRGLTNSEPLGCIVF